MRGIIFAKLRQYVALKLGDQAWKELLDEAEVPPKTFLAGENYPDEDLFRIVGAIVKKTNLPLATAVEDFGKFLAPHLLDLYKHLLDPKWRTLEVIEHTDETIHHVVRAKGDGARPPVLKCNRQSPNEIVIDYASPRKLCFLAVGIAHGLAEKFGDKVDVSQSSCMHNGASKCLISVKVVK